MKGEGPMVRDKSLPTDPTGDDGPDQRRAPQRARASLIPDPSSLIPDPSSLISHRSPLPAAKRGAARNPEAEQKHDVESDHESG